MQIVSKVTLAHLRYMQKMDRHLRANSDADASANALSYEEIIGFIVSIKDSEGMALAAKVLPTSLASNDLAPYLVLAATTEAEDLIPFLEDPKGEAHSEAHRAAKRLTLTEDVPALVRGLLGFFGLFSPWFGDIRDYLANQGP
jgi:hypothetical protein